MQRATTIALRERCLTGAFTRNIGKGTQAHKNFSLEWEDGRNRNSSCTLMSAQEQKWIEIYLFQVQWRMSIMQISLEEKREHGKIA